ncbi:unnamed protein product [Urochloa humidicola]
MLTICVVQAKLSKKMTENIGYMSTWNPKTILPPPSGQRQQILLHYWLCSLITLEESEGWGRSQDMQLSRCLKLFVRLCAKSREAVSSCVEHLTLHYQVHP